MSNNEMEGENSLTDPNEELDEDLQNFQDAVNDYFEAEEGDDRTFSDFAEERGWPS